MSIGLGRPSMGTSQGRVYEIPTMEQMFLQQLHLHHRRGHQIQDLTAGLDMPAMMADFARFMSNHLATGTWEGYGRIWTDLLNFTSEVGLPVCEYTAALFLRRRMLTPYKRGRNGVQRYYLISTIYGNAKQIMAISEKLPSHRGWGVGLLPAFCRILVKMGAKIPQFQAQPILKEEVYRLLQDLTVPEHQKMLIFLTWKVAGRADDMEKANTDDTQFVEHCGLTLLVIRWRPKAKENLDGILRMPGSGVQKNISHGIGHSCVVDCGEYLDRVRAYLRTRKGKPISPYSADQVTAFLKAHVDPRLSAHSVKRGALQYLLEQGVDFRILTEMARHAHTMDWLPMVTRVYLQSIALALAMGTHKATRLL